MRKALYFPFGYESTIGGKPMNTETFQWHYNLFIVNQWPIYMLLHQCVRATSVQLHY